MRAALFVTFALVLALVVGARAEDKEKEEKGKEVTLKGSLTCAKCDLKIEEKCTTVIKVKDKDDKDVVYYLDEKSGKKNHKAICTEAKEGSVTGVISKKGDKNIITASKVTFKE